MTEMGQRRTVDWHQGLRLANRYVLRRFVGKGGMGQVWVAFDEVLDKEVALKRVRADVIAAESALASMRREVLLAQTVTHVNVCRLYDLEELAGDWVVKMEVVSGRSLADILREDETLPLSRVLSIARQLAAGFAAVHAVGVVHRDLKPANVLVDDDGRAVIMDFGIARSAASTGDPQNDAIVGTPEYMAPEQVRAQTVDGRADLYAFGCVLYRMLTGAVPFPAPSRLAAMARHLIDPPPDPRTKRPDTPAWLAKLTTQLMAKAPSARPRNASTLVARLAGPPPRWPIWLRGSLAAVGAAAIVAGAIGWRAHVRGHWRPVIADLPREQDMTGRVAYPSYDGTNIAFTTLHKNEVGPVMVAPVAGGRERAVTPPGYDLLGWARNGRALYVSDPRGSLYRAQLDGGLEPLGYAASGVADCADAGLITVENAHDVCPLCSRVVQHRADGAARELVSAKNDASPSEVIACDPVGRRLAYVTSDFQRARLHLRALDGERDREIETGHRSLGLGSFTDRGTLIFGTMDADNTAHAWELSIESGRTRQLTFGDDSFRPMATTDGRLFFLGRTITSALWTARADGSGAEQLTFGQEKVGDVIPTPDGRAVVLNVSRQYGGDDILLLHPLDGSPERQLASAPSLRATSRFVDGKFYFQKMDATNSQGPLWVYSSSDGVVRRVRDLPPGWLQGEGRDRLFFMERRADGKWRGLDIPLDGGPVVRQPEAAWTWLSEAPQTRWRLAWREESYGLFPPGASLNGSPVHTFDRFVQWSHDGRAILHVRDGKVWRYDVMTGDDRVVVASSDAFFALESGDGKMIYYAAGAWRSRRQVITNFADRPPL